MSISNQPTDAFGATRDFISSLSESWLPIRQSDLDRNKVESHHYNPLRSITIKETDHSRILGELLKPNGSHGKGSLFLNSFLKRIGITPVEGNWIVTVESDRIDILLRRESPSSVVIIENKACKASDQPGQLYRYWFRQIYLRYPNLCYDELGIREQFRIVYLPPSGYTRPTENSLLRPGDEIHANCDHPNLPQTILDCRSFEADVADWLNELVATDSGFSHRLRTFLNLYAQIWRL